MIQRLPRPLVSAEAVGLILVITALQALAYGIASSLRGTHYGYLFWVCLLAAATAFGLGRIGTSGPAATAIIPVIGLVGIWVLGARLGTPLTELGREIVLIIPGVFQSVRSPVPVEVDAAQIAESWAGIVQASNILQLRLTAWLGAYAKGAPIEDGLVRDMLWSLLLWTVSAWLGWFATRRRALPALLPAIVLLAAVTSYSERTLEALWLLVFLLILLLGLWNYRNQTRHWEREAVDYSESIIYDSGAAVLLLACLIGFVAYSVPSVSWQEIRDSLRRPDPPGVSDTADLLGIEREPASDAQRTSPRPSLPREHLLGGGFAHSETVVMTIRTGELSPVPDSRLTARPPRHYWRSTTYDVYAGTGWVTSSAPPQPIEPGTPLIPGLLDGYELLNLEVHMHQPEGRLFWSGLLFSADIPLTANWRVRAQPGLFSDQSALLEADLFAARADAISYHATSYVPVISVEELQAASSDYPDAIRARYLELPATVPEEVHRLARQITNGRTTPYEKARAIEAHLRTYPYDLDVSAPPAGRDVIAYFLFDLRKGYCDYYATAMVVLARSAGLPSRFVSGYAPGEYDAPNARYIVRELHAHSWAEVYFPNIGWVEFEPTAAQPEIPRPLTDSSPAPGSGEDPAASALLQRFRWQQRLDWILPVSGILAVLILYFGLLETWWLNRLTPQTAIEKMHQRLYRLGRPLAGERTNAETPHEFMQRLIDRIELMKSGSHLGFVLSPAPRHINQLTAIYSRSIFGPTPVETADAQSAWVAWRRLRIQLVVARLIVLAGRLRGTGQLRANHRLMQD